MSNVKLIAEPWDVGEGGYQVGNFPPNWSEWNGKYRDCVRDYWKGSEQTLGEFGSRLTGSSDLYETTGRKPFASINFLTAHDGFTLHDLVSYNDKHNDANGEANRDGESHNRSWNCGTEGPSEDPEVKALRQKQKRNFLTTLLLSQGIPMLLGGDEIGRTQHGNNNAYCQDNEISWLDWTKADPELLEFAISLIRLRKEHPIFRRRKYFMGRSIRGTKMCDIAWLRPDGREMTEEDWNAGHCKTLGVFLNGRGLTDVDVTGEPLKDDSFYIVFNAHHEPIEFTLPQEVVSNWIPVLNTTHPVPARMRMEKTMSDMLPIPKEEPAPETNEATVEKAESTFDDLAGLASHICESPLGCITLTEAGKQWFKVQGDLPEEEQRRDVAFCSQANVDEELLEIADVAHDKRFSSNELVTTDRPIRFFAGSCLLSGNGEKLGTLCVVDHKSHTLSETQKEALKTVSRQVIAQLELRRQLGSLPRNGSNGHPPSSNKSSETSSGADGAQKIQVEGRSIALFRSAEQNEIC